MSNIGDYLYAQRVATFAAKVVCVSMQIRSKIPLIPAKAVGGTRPPPADDTAGVNSVLEVITNFCIFRNLGVG